MGRCSSVMFVPGDRVQVIKADDYDVRRGLQIGAVGEILSTYEAIGGPAAYIRLDEEYVGGNSLGGLCEDGHGVQLLFTYITRESVKELPEFETAEMNVMSLFS